MGEGVNQNVGHVLSFPLDELALVEPGDDLLDRGGRVFVGDDGAAGLLGRSLEVACSSTPEPAVPTLPASMPASASVSFSTGFFFAPMIALSDG